MKKIFAKLALYILISTILNIATISMVKADETDNLLNALDDVEECVQDVNEDGSPGLDAGYIITIIEEPLDIEESRTDNFIQRKCYRNTLQIIHNESSKSAVVHELAKSCSAKGQQLSQNPPEGFKIKFSCRQVQVLLSKGGTALIYGYISTIYKWGASVVGIIAVLVIVISGIQIATAGGDSEAINSGKKRILQSLAGIVVLLLSALILYTINPNFFVK